MAQFFVYESYYEYYSATKPQYISCAFHCSLWTFSDSDRHSWTRCCSWYRSNTGTSRSGSRLNCNPSFICLHIFFSACTWSDSSRNIDHLRSPLAKYRSLSNLMSGVVTGPFRQPFHVLKWAIAIHENISIAIHHRNLGAEVLLMLRVVFFLWCREA